MTPPFFQAPCQTESESVVYTIVSDLAEEVYYAKYQKIPDTNQFCVSFREDGGTYHFQIDLDANHKGLMKRLDLNGPIWSPELYGRIAGQLTKAVELPSNSNKGS